MKKVLLSLLSFTLLIRAMHTQQLIVERKDGKELNSSELQTFSKLNIRQNGISEALWVPDKTRPEREKEIAQKIKAKKAILITVIQLPELKKLQNNTNYKLSPYKLDLHNLLT